MDTFLGLLGMVLIFGLPIAFSILLYRRAEKKIADQAGRAERRIFFTFLVAIISAGFVVLLGILFKSDWLFVIGFLVFGIVVAVRRFIYVGKISNQEEGNNQD